MVKGYNNCFTWFLQALYQHLRVLVIFPFLSICRGTDTVSVFRQENRICSSLIFLTKSLAKFYKYLNQPQHDMHENIFCHYCASLCIHLSLKTMQRSHPILSYFWEQFCSCNWPWIPRCASSYKINIKQIFITKKVLVSWAYPQFRFFALSLSHP